LHGITTVSFDAVTCLVRHSGGGDDPADVAWFHQGAIEPIAAGAGFVNEDELLAFRPQPPAKLIDITLPSPDRAKGDALGTMCLGDIGDGTGLLMHIHSDVERARL
jgi:hypothetical protein